MKKSVSKKVESIEKVIELLRNDPNFFDKDSSYSSHNFHAFAAKFPPQLPRIFIEHLTNEGDTVLDPMVGSGTTIVEALLLGRNAIGYDIDPLAIHISNIKTSGLNAKEISTYFNKVISIALNNLSNTQLITEQLDQRFDVKTREFLDYWFKNTTQKELMALLLAIEKISNKNIREFYKLIFSSIIITKSGGVTLARDLAHSRPHRDIKKIPKNALEVFGARFNKILSRSEWIPDNGTNSIIKQNDAKKLPLNDESVDLIISSPPYANAIDYMRAHKFSLVWFGIPITQLSLHRSKYIGSEKIFLQDKENLPNFCNTTIKKVENLDHKKAKILRKYFCEMKIVLSEMKRVLKKGKWLILIVGNSTMRGYEVKTDINLLKIGEMIGLEVHGNIVRQLDRGRRMMPTSFRTGREGIEHRMHEEYILIFRKTD